MNKTLLLVRHAKSAWPEGVPDFERGLTSSGKVAAQKLGVQLKETGLYPDFILCSAAKRTRKTAKHLLNGLASNILIEAREDFYQTTIEHLANSIRQLSNNFETIMLVLHNPEVTTLINHLASDLYIDEMPTAGCVVLDFEIDEWINVRARTGKTRMYAIRGAFEQKTV